jgi:dolichol-phosphate mannosyltransferase
MAGPSNQEVVSIIIPAYNEEKNLPKVVSDLQRALQAAAIPYEIILVNDNSTDETPRVIGRLMASDPYVRTVDRSPPGGFGRAVRAGLEVVRGDIVVICMADCSDVPDDVVRYYHMIREGYDCVFGSRFMRESVVKHYPFVKLVVNRAVNRVIQFLFRCPFNDLTNAFKAYRSSVLNEIGSLQASHFNLTIELSLSALNRGYRIAQIPIQWHGRTWGSSKLKLREMGRRYLATLVKLYAERALITDDVMAELEAVRREKSKEGMYRTQAADDIAMTEPSLRTNTGG